ncbi:MAG: class II aldolase/adducin family protein [Pseudomonadota bacterium]
MFYRRIGYEYLMHTEGIIKFHADHLKQALPNRQYQDLACKLVAWREVLTKTQLVGQDPQRYGGAGFGNVSGRVGPPSAARGQRSFLITGTQTGGTACITLDHFALVQKYDYQQNSLQSVGLIQPSSEALTHGAIYDLSPSIRFTIHAHSPTIWKRARQLQIPTSAESVEYGTAKMAFEVQRLHKTTSLSEVQIMAMGGHEDGIVVFGRNAEEAGRIMIKYLAHAYELDCLGGICVA